MNYLMAVDPGINACGVAIWEERPRAIKNRLTPSQAFSIYGSDLTKPWDYKVQELIEKLEKITEHQKFKIIVTEFPQFFEGAKGNAAAKQGDVTHMAHFCGMLNAFAIKLGAIFVAIEVTDWKGQLDKDIVEKRLQRVTGPVDLENKKITDHAIDAVGVGLVYSGYPLDSPLYLKKNAKYKDIK